MAIYTFKNKETNEEFDIHLKISELDEYKKTNPHLEQILRKITTVNNTGGLKPPGGFRDLLSHIKENNIGSSIDKGNLSNI